MGTVTLRPNGVASEDGNFANIGGAGSKQAATSDNSDSTYLQHSPGAITGNGTDQYPAQINLDVGAPGLPAGAQVRTVTPRMRMQNTSIVGTKGFVFGIGDGTQAVAELYTTTGAGFSTITGTTRPNLNGTPWTPAMVDALIVFVLAYYNAFGSVSPSWQVAELYADVVYNERPVGTVTAPTEGSTLTTTNAPTVSWTYSDPESDAQERFRVKVFTAAQYGAGGFDPETSPAFYDSGDVVSSATSHALPPLDNSTTYRAYVKVGDATPVGYAAKWSAWDSNTFTINITPPGVPTVSAPTYSTVTHAMSGNVTSGTIPATGTGHRFRLERSIDGGTTWRAVRGFTAKQFGTGTGGAGTVVAWVDYELPRGATAIYRARSTAEVSALSLTSAWSASTAGVLAVKAGCWNLKSPSDPTKNLIGVNATPQRLRSVSKIPTAVFAAQGRREPIVHQGVAQAKAFDAIEFFLASDAELAAFEALRTRREPLLLQMTYGDTLPWEQVWVRLGDLTEERVTYEAMNTAAFRFATVAVLEVAEPAAG